MSCIFGQVIVWLFVEVYTHALKIAQSCNDKRSLKMIGSPLKLNAMRLVPLLTFFLSFIKIHRFLFELIGYRLKNKQLNQCHQEYILLGRGNYDLEHTYFYFSGTLKHKSHARSEALLCGWSEEEADMQSVHVTYERSSADYYLWTPLLWHLPAGLLEVRKICTVSIEACRIVH